MAINILEVSFLSSLRNLVLFGFSGSDDAAALLLPAQTLPLCIFSPTFW